jgi:hypothetical protein
MSGAEAVFNDKEMAALFEPIPRPKTVEIPLELAQAIWSHGGVCGKWYTMLDAAIRAAEKEQTP